MKVPGHHALDTLARKLGKCPEVAGAWEVTGDDDFVLKVQVGSMEEYDAFTRRVFDENVKSFKSLITIRTVVEDDPSRRPLLGA
jgi:DNA-binding Lrp family transcriptional regulator